ncbi:MAG: methionine gamma-lyase family protein [Bacilli bacterium]|nr:methionine gamma-lyase family protein [Bacilli bacterium]
MNKDLKKIIEEVDNEILKDERFKLIDEVEDYYSEKIIKAFKEEQLSMSDLNGTTGYGYGDVGRDKIDRIFANVLDSESALVRSQFISGTHALTVTLFGLLRPSDILLSITGKPYDTMDEVIGIKENPSSLKAFGINFDYIDLIKDEFDFDSIEKYLKTHKVKVIDIQRSRGYADRKAISISKLQKVVEFIRTIDKDVIIMVDNCYCEMTDIINPTSPSVGCDIMVGSLIKNLGGGIASNGAYVAGRSNLVELVSERLTVPGQGAEVGPSGDMNKQILMGLYLAPSVVASSVKTNIFASLMLEKLGFSTNPSYKDARCDIVLGITFNNPDKLIKFVEGIQEYSAIDNYIKPIPSDMPGYSDKIIMASGSFTQGSSIEISCDGPLRPPYIAYLQGGLTYKYGRLAVINAVRKLLNENE